MDNTDNKNLSYLKYNSFAVFGHLVSALAMIFLLNGKDSVVIPYTESYSEWTSINTNSSCPYGSRSFDTNNGKFCIGSTTKPVSCNDDLKNKYLPKLASGEFVGCFGLTEPNHGSDPSSMETKAVDDGNNYILNGSKTWISNSPIADVFIIWAKLDNKVRGFLLDRDMEGITTPKIDGKLSLRTSVTGMIQLDDVKVPKDNILNVEGLKGPFSCLNDARLGISFGVLGAAENCIDETIKYVQDRKQFGKSLAEKQLIQYKLADMYSEYNLGLLGCYQVATLVDDKESIPEMISLIKRNSCQKSLDISRKCRDILGGNGISEEYHIFRHLTNLETVNTYEGTHDIHSLILGKHLTGYSAF